MKSDKIIIGAGITGLVWKFYHPEFQVIAPNIGGTYARSYLVWYHDTPDTRKLLKDLEIPIKLKKSYIGYYNNGWILDNVSTEMNLLMIQKKMTEWDKALDKNFVPKTKNLSLSNGQIMGTAYMNTLDVDLGEVIKRLNINADVKDGLITQIGPKSLTVQEPDMAPYSLEYSKLITTIAAPFFWKSWGTEKEFKCLPITNVVVGKKPRLFDDRFEMIYYDDSVPFTRMSHIQGKWAIEFTGFISEEEFKKRFPDLPVLDYFVVKQGRIFESDDNVPPTENIIFSGRFSQWKYEVTSEHVISQAINYKK